MNKRIYLSSPHMSEEGYEQEYVNNQISHLSALYNYNVALAKRDRILGNTNGDIKWKRW